MRRYLRVGLKEPVKLGNGTLVAEFSASDDTTILRVPPEGWPAKLVIHGPSGSYESDWAANVRDWDEDFIPGPDPFVTVPMISAREFVDHLTDSFVESRYLFRGLPCATYGLVPSALRSNVADTGAAQIKKESKVLLGFYEAAYYQGLSIPGWSHVSEFMRRLRQGSHQTTIWPPDELHEFMGLAQHHGVPTRLLDWTLDPMVAAYFAVRPINGEPSSTDVAVWILDSSAYGGAQFRRPLGIRIADPVIVPYDVNRNAHAQRGVFTIHLPVQDTAVSPSIDSLDVVVSRLSVVDPPGGLQKVTLPRSETSSAMRLLDRRRINGTTMFPGYDGAVRAAKERSGWDS